MFGQGHHTDTLLGKCIAGPQYFIVAKTITNTCQFKASSVYCTLRSLQDAAEMPTRLTKTRKQYVFLRPLTLD
jgi:hypothetical protein